MDINNRRVKSTYEVAIIRFWNKVDKKSEDECWNWKGGKTGMGYGLMTICQKLVLVHRYSFELHNGKIEKGLCVCHKCDNPLCVNPKHLYVGTHQENMDDISTHKRHPSIKNPEKYKEFGKKLGLSNKGRKHTEEEKEKVRQTMLQRIKDGKHNLFKKVN